MAQLQAKLVTKDERYQVPTVPLGVPSNALPDDLNGLVNSLLLGMHDCDVEDSELEEERTLIEFDFLVNGELLRSALGYHVEQKGLPTESVIEIEFVVKRAPPEPSFSIPHEDWVSAVCCCQDRILTGCYDAVTRLWDNAGNRMADFAGHEAAIKDVAWISCDNVSAVFVTASQDETLRVWQYDFDSKSTNCINVCEGHVQSVESVAVNAASKTFCSGSWDGTIKIWSSELSSNVDNVEFPKPKRFKGAKKKKPIVETKKGPISTLLGHGQAVSAVTWVDNDSLCSSGWDHCIRLWDLDSGVNTTTLTGSGVLHCIAYSPLNGLLASGSSDRCVRLWDARVPDGKMVKMILTSHTGWVSSVDWSKTSENELVSGSYDTTLRLWDTRTPKVPLFVMTSHEAKVLCLDWSQPQMIASGGADNQLHIHRTVR